MAVLSFIIVWLALALQVPALALARPRGAGRLKSSGPREQENFQNAAVLPLVLLCGAVLLLCVLGCFGLLRWGVPLVLAAALASAVSLAVQAVRGGRAFGRRLCALCTQPALLMYAAGSLLIFGFMAVRRPLFTQWDEFSFWGTAAKVVKQNDALYTLVGQTNLAARSYPPALALLSYLFSFFAPEFEPWLLFAAYGTLYFAVFAAVAGQFPRRAAGPAAFCALACVLAPFAVESWYPGQQLAAYSSAYSDLMLGLLCAGGCAVWYGAVRDTGAGTPLRGARYAAALAGTACVTALLGLVKDVGLPLGLVLMLVCFADHTACDYIRYKKDARAAARGLGVALALCAAALAAYLLWAYELKAALGQDRSDTGAANQLSTFGMVTAGVRELFGIGRSEKFSAVLSAMGSAFFRTRVTVFGSGLATAAVIGLVLCIAFVLAPRGWRRRPVCFALTSGVGFAGYYFFQLLCYVYVFSETDGRGLASYARYMSTYYLFWLLGALLLLAWAAGCGRRAGGLCQLGAAAALLAVCCLRFSPADTLLGRQAPAWDTETVIAARAGQASAASRQGVLLVSQWDDSARWYRYAYELEPCALYHAVGDNTIVSDGEKGEYPLRLTAQNIGDFMAENHCDVLLVDVADDYFYTEFGPLFTDGLAGYFDGTNFAYRVEQTAQGVRFVPCGEGGGAA